MLKLKDNAALRVAARNGHDEIVKILIASGARVGSNSVEFWDWFDSGT